MKREREILINIFHDIHWIASTELAEGFKEALPEPAAGAAEDLLLETRKVGMRWLKEVSEVLSSAQKVDHVRRRLSQILLLFQERKGLNMKCRESEGSDWSLHSFFEHFETVCSSTALMFCWLESVVCQASYEVGGHCSICGVDFPSFWEGIHQQREHEGLAQGKGSCFALRDPFWISWDQLWHIERFWQVLRL